MSEQTGGTDQPVTTPTPDRGGSTPDRSPNDDRSDVKNPTSPDHAADQANQEKQRSGGD